MKKTAPLILKNNDIDIFYVHNLTLKKFSDNVVKYKKTSFDCIKGFFRDNRHKGTLSEEELDDKNLKYLKETRSSIVDLAYENSDNFDWFVTLTFDNRQLGGVYTHEKAVEKLSQWLKNQRKQSRGMYYLFVPELHPDSKTLGGRLHFHGLVGGVTHWKVKKAINSKTGKFMKINNTQIYNLLNYKLGFTTLSKIKNKEAVSNYISKYATKDILNLLCLKHKKKYWYSRNLRKPIVDYDFIDTSLEDHLKGYDIKYYDIFKTENREIELCSVQLPIIDSNGS